MVNELIISEYEGIIQTSKTVVIDFYANWCGPCRMLSPIMDKISEHYPHIKFYKCNVDRCGTIARDLKITSIPAVFIFHNGELFDSFVGFRPENEVKIILDRVAREL